MCLCSRNILTLGTEIFISSLGTFLFRSEFNLGTIWAVLLSRTRFHVLLRGFNVKAKLWFHLMEKNPVCDHCPHSTQSPDNVTWLDQHFWESTHSTARLRSSFLRPSLQLFPSAWPAGQLPAGDGRANLWDVLPFPPGCALTHPQPSGYFKCKGELKPNRF